MGKVVRCNKQDGIPFFEKECLYKRGQIKKDDKTCLQCPFQKNEISKLRNPPQVVVNKPGDLAKDYLEGKSIFQESLFIDTILQEKARDVTLQSDSPQQSSDRIFRILKESIGRDDTLQSLAQKFYGDQSKYDPVTKSLENLKLQPSIQKKIHTALADFTLALSEATRGNIKNKIKGGHH